MEEETLNRDRDGDRYPIRTVKSTGWKTASKRAPPPSAPAPYKTDIIQKDKRDYDIENYSDNNNDAGKLIKPQKSSSRYLSENENIEDDGNREFRKPRFSSTNSSRDDDSLRSSIEKHANFKVDNDNDNLSLYDKKNIKSNNDIERYEEKERSKQNVSEFEKYVDEEEKKGNILPRKSGRYNAPKEVNTSIEFEEGIDAKNKSNTKDDDILENDDDDDDDEEEEDDNNDENYTLSHSPEVKLDNINSETSVPKIKGISDDTNPSRSEVTSGKIPKPMSFINKAHRQGVRTDLVQCVIIRDRTGMTGGRLFPTYELINENTKKTILLAKKMNLNRTSNYHFFDMTRGAAGSKLTKKSGNYLGKVRAKNGTGTEYVLLSKNSVSHDELAAVMFDRLSIFEQLKEGSQPRKMSVALPPLDSDDCPIPQPMEEGGKSMIGSLYSSKKDFKMHYLETKEPVFENGNFRLNFGGRVTSPSVKNYQLVYSHDVNEIICQFGKVGDERFHLDYKFPLNALQAFATAICQFNL